MLLDPEICNYDLTLFKLLAYIAKILTFRGWCIRHCKYRICVYLRIILKLVLQNKDQVPGSQIFRLINHCQISSICFIPIWNYCMD